MYASSDDPYCYEGTNVLRNKLGIRNAKPLEDFEEEITKQRAAETLPRGRLSVSRYCAIHRHLFQDVFTWAGRSRTARVAKGGSMFAYPEHLSMGLRQVFADLRRADLLRRLSANDFATGAAHVLAELNALHPFRDGNGRTQAIFLGILAEQAQHPIDLDRVDSDSFLAAMITSFRGDERPLANRIVELIV